MKTLLAAFLVVSISVVNADIDPDAHAPIGVMGDHYHKAGEMMFSYRFMYMSMQENLDGKESISPEKLVTSIPNKFSSLPMMPPTLRVAPTKMSMQMHMLGIMYAPNNRITLMGMVNQNILANDTINRMTDDVDLDLFDTTPQDMPTSTFDADTFDDDVSFNDFDDLDDGGGGGGINIPSTFDPSLEEAMFAEAAAREQEEAAAREQAKAPSPPTGTDRPGGDSRDDSPAPSPSPTTSQGVTTSQFQAFRDTGGGGDGPAGGADLAHAHVRQVRRADLRRRSDLLPVQVKE